MMSTTAACDLLRSEHRLIEAQLDRLSCVVKHRECVVVSEARAAFSEIQRLSRSHFKKEDEVLYRFLRSKFLELLSELDDEHEYVREVEHHVSELLAEIQGSPADRQKDELIRFASELCDVIQHHIVEEEDQLLRLADSTLSQEEQCTLAMQMTDSGHSCFAGSQPRGFAAE